MDARHGQRIDRGLKTSVTEVDRKLPRAREDAIAEVRNEKSKDLALQSQRVKRDELHSCNMLYPNNDLSRERGKSMGVEKFEKALEILRV